MCDQIFSSIHFSVKSRKIGRMEMRFSEEEREQRLTGLLHANNLVFM